MCITFELSLKNSFVILQILCMMAEEVVSFRYNSTAMRGLQVYESGSLNVGHQALRLFGVAAQTNREICPHYGIYYIGS